MNNRHNAKTLIKWSAGRISVQKCGFKYIFPSILNLKLSLNFVPIFPVIVQNNTTEFSITFWNFKGNCRSLKSSVTNYFLMKLHPWRIMWLSYWLQTTTDRQRNRLCFCKDTRDSFNILKFITTLLNNQLSCQSLLEKIRWSLISCVGQDTSCSPNRPFSLHNTLKNVKFCSKIRLQHTWKTTTVYWHEELFTIKFSKNTKTFGLLIKT